MFRAEQSKWSISVRQHVHSVRVWGGGCHALGGETKDRMHMYACVCFSVHTHANTGTTHRHYTHTLDMHTCKHTPAQPLDEDQDREEEQYLEVRQKRSKKKSVS
jgi:hypothetical protein